MLLAENERFAFFSKVQEKLNVVFNYDDLMIQGFPEKDFLEKKIFLDKNGQKWADEWENAKTDYYKSQFLKHLNKNVNPEKLRLLCGDYPDALYQSTVRVLTVGRNWDITCEVIFKRIGDSVPLAIITVKGKQSKTIGRIRGVGPNVYQTARSFGYAGQNLGKFMEWKMFKYMTKI